MVHLLGEPAHELEGAAVRCRGGGGWRGARDVLRLHPGALGRRLGGFFHFRHGSLLSRGSIIHLESHHGRLLQDGAATSIWLLTVCTPSMPETSASATCLRWNV